MSVSQSVSRKQNTTTTQYAASERHCSIVCRRHSSAHHGKAHTDISAVSGGQMSPSSHGKSVAAAAASSDNNHKNGCPQLLFAVGPASNDSHDTASQHSGDEWRTYGRCR